jgi:aspartate/methionine/tyrosine aminotransferase
LCDGQGHPTEGRRASLTRGHHVAVRIADFALERYFARWEFVVDHVLGASDVEGWSMAELLELADDETAALWRDLRLGYTESTGHPLLRREIAALYETIEADDVLVFAGAEEAIFCLFSTALRPGDHVIVTSPGYQSLHEVARAAGADVTLHELREADDWALDVDRLVASFRPSTRMAVVNAPHQPTGMLPTPEEWQRLGEACAAAGIRLVADEVYRFLEHDGAPTLAAGADLDPSFVSIGVMSKSFALAGLRIGWLASRDRELLARCVAMKDYTTICSSAPSEILALIGLRARHQVLARSRAIVAQNLPVADDFFARQPDALTWVRPRGGSTAFPRLVPGGPAGASAEAFCARLVEATAVLLLPSTVFGSDDGHVRLGLGRTDFAEALGKVEAFLDRG